MRLLLFALWRAILAALVALLFVRVDGYVERSRVRDSVAGRAWRAYRSRRRKDRPGAPPARTIDTEGRPQP